YRALACHSCVPPRDLLAFPTRRSSDLEPPRRPGKLWTDVHSNLEGPEWNAPSFSSNPMGSLAASSDRSSPGSKTRATGSTRSTRSEEHTSELQSRFDLVCRLLREKKKE